MEWNVFPVGLCCLFSAALLKDNEKKSLIQGNGVFFCTFLLLLLILAVVTKVRKVQSKEKKKKLNPKFDILNVPVFGHWFWMVVN